MDKVTKGMAANMADLNDVYLKEYKKKAGARSFAEWFEEKYNFLFLKKRLEEQSIERRKREIKIMFQRDEHKKTITDKDGTEKAKDDLAMEYRNLGEMKSDAALMSLTEAFGLYMCAKKKIESRSSISRFFHPFRTKKERAKLTELKNDLMTDYDIIEKVFDKVVDFVSGGEQYKDISAVLNDGTLLKNEDLITDKDKTEIEEYVTKEKIIDEEIRNNEEMEKDFENLKSAEKDAAAAENGNEIDDIEFDEKDIEVIKGENEVTAPGEVKGIADMLKEEFAVKPQKKPEEKEKKAENLTAEKAKDKKSVAVNAVKKSKS